MIEYIYTDTLAKTYGVKISTVQRWVREGRLPETNRALGSNASGSPYQWHPDQLKGWKPPKRGKSLSVDLPARSRMGMWDVGQAASETGHSKSNLYRWIRQGHLQAYQSGGKVYIWPDHLRGFRPPKRGRPKAQDISVNVPPEDAWAVPGSDGLGHSEGELSEA